MGKTNSKAAQQRQQQKRAARNSRAKGSGTAPRVSTPSDPLAGMSQADLDLARTALSNPKMAKRIEKATARSGVTAEQLALVKDRLEAAPEARRTASGVPGAPVSATGKLVGAAIALFIAAIVFIGLGVVLLAGVGGIGGVIGGIVAIAVGVVAGVVGAVIRNPARAVATLGSRRQSLEDELHSS